MIEKAVAHIGDGQLVERVERHAVGLFPGHDRRRVANGARAKASARAIGRRRVERHASDGNVDALRSVTYLRRMKDVTPA